MCIIRFLNGNAQQAMNYLHFSDNVFLPILDLPVLPPSSPLLSRSSFFSTFLFVSFKPYVFPEMSSSPVVQSFQSFVHISYSQKISLAFFVIPVSF